MTEAERKRLLDCMPLAPSPIRSRRFGLTLIAQIIGLTIADVFLLYIRKEPAVFVIPITVGFYVLWWLFHFKSRILTPLRRWREANQKVSGFHNAVTTAQTVRVHCVESDTVVVVAHDEGMICLFDVGSSQTYWIDPSCMIPGKPSKDWPSSRFEVVEIPGWNEEIGPFCKGTRLQPRRTFEFRDLFEHYDFEPPTDGLIRQALDAFIAEAKTRNQKVGAT